MGKTGVPNPNYIDARIERNKLNKLNRNTGMYENKNYIINDFLKWRLYRNYTQEELSEKIKISIHCLRNIETKNYYPIQKIRERICRIFDISEHQIFFVDKER